MALFQFVNSFLSLFYIAFYLRDQEKLKEVGHIPRTQFIYYSFIYLSAEISLTFHRRPAN